MEASPVAVQLLVPSAVGRLQQELWLAAEPAAAVVLVWQWVLLEVVVWRRRRQVMRLPASAVRLLEKLLPGAVPWCHWPQALLLHWAVVAVAAAVAGLPGLLRPAALLPSALLSLVLVPALQINDTEEGKP